MKDFCDFSVQNSFQGFAEWKNSTNMKTVVILDYGIGTKCNDSYPLIAGKSLGIFIKDPNDSSGYFTGRDLSGDIYYIDFTHPNASDYWSSMLVYLDPKISFDGVLLPIVPFIL